MSVACRLCRSCQQTSPVFSLSTEDFNQTTHLTPYEHIAFNDNLSFILTLSSVQDVLKGSCHGHIMVISTWFSTHLEIFDMVFNTPCNFQHSFQYTLKFSTQFSIPLENFNMVFHTVFNMLHNIGGFQNCTFHIFHTFNARSSLTVMLCFWVGFYTLFSMG